MEKGFLGSSVPTEEELQIINKFTKRQMSAEEVYSFSVVLCDNDIDRDFERFTPAALEKLAELFIGKTGIFDHSMKGKDQVARIYQTTVEKTGEQTSFGEPYIRLKAQAYLPRTSKNEDFILKLDAGIYKEVSVGCAVGHRYCSICGADLNEGVCEHRKGEMAGDMKNQQCHIILDEPYDAYEWSFVAVPAQRRAGVIKGFRAKGGEEMKREEIIKALSNGEVTLSESQAKTLKAAFDELKEGAKIAEETLKKECVKSAMLTLPTLCAEEIDGLFEGMGIAALTKWHKALSGATLDDVQLSSQNKPSTSSENHSFKI